MESKTVYFDRPGPENTDAVLSLARQRAGELGIKTVLVASTKGDTAVRAVDAFPSLKVIIVTHSTGFRAPDTQSFTEENRALVVGGGE